MTSPKPAVLGPSAEAWPHPLTERLAATAPPMLHVVGPAELLTGRKVAIFCSARTPGAAILRAHDAARRMRDEGVTVISGFHSPIEKECLQILLRGMQPIIICPGRTIETMRIPATYRAAFDAGRILFLSPFTGQPRRVTKESALRRNEVVAALADEAYIGHLEQGGKTDAIVRKLNGWGVPTVVLTS